MSYANIKTKIIFSLRIHIALRKLGFKPVEVMPNYLKDGYTCWVYELTPQLQEALDAILETEGGGRK